MDVFGSNATPMGRSAGRGDGMIGAVEAQKTEGVLHLHMFIFIQMCNQFATLREIADKLRAGILSATAWKEYASHVRCAAYPDGEKAEAERKAVEKAWPAYATDQTLSRLPADLWATTSEQTFRACPLSSTSDTGMDAGSSIAAADVTFGMDAVLGGGDVWFGDSFERPVP